jgi:beta-lactamase class A
MKHNLILVGPTLLALLVGFWGGHEWEEQRVHVHDEYRVQSYVNGALTNPLLECAESADELSVGERAAIERTVRTYLEGAIKRGMVTEAAVYFRDLNNGPWFGINERELFTPASLLKLPLAMSVYWKQQRDMQTLSDEIEYVPIEEVPVALENQYSSDAPLPAATYTLRDLVGIMLRESSNDAASLIAEYQGEDRVLGIYKDFGIDVPSYTSDYEIDVKTYGAFFRVLYNASYLGQPASEELLATLTEAAFKDGIVAGVPQDVKVAHKFGTRTGEVGAGYRQLHDCGIVYAPRAPYILCVMSQGNSTENLAHFIAQVSEKVYAGVTK